MVCHMVYYCDNCNTFIPQGEKIETDREIYNFRGTFVNLRKHKEIIQYKSYFSMSQNSDYNHTQYDKELLYCDECLKKSGLNKIE